MQFTKHFVIFISIIFLTLSWSNNLHAEDDVITDIILINGIAELVDLNVDGDILQRHVAVPDYFSSGRSHKRSLRKSLAKLKIFGSVEENGDEVSYVASVECRQSLMRNQEELNVVKENIALNHALTLHQDDYLNVNVSEEISSINVIALDTKLPVIQIENFLFIRQRHNILMRSENVRRKVNAYLASKAVTEV